MDFYANKGSPRGSTYSGNGYLAQTIIISYIEVQSAHDMGCLDPFGSRSGQSVRVCFAVAL